MKVTIYHGDCRELLPSLPKVDLVQTDPPYGIERFARGFGTTRFKGHGCEKAGIVWDVKPTPELLSEVMAKGHAAIIWGANNFTLPTSESFLVWDKVQSVDNFASAELAFTNLLVTAKVFRFPIHRHNQIAKSHPTQKPVELMRWCLALAGGAKTILDPFMGSGTTLRAAKDLGRKAIGIEIEEKYCEIAAKRCDEAQPNLIETAERESQGRMI
jgi:DNA modification methylase